MLLWESRRRLDASAEKGLRGWQWHLLIKRGVKQIKTTDWESAAGWALVVGGRWEMIGGAGTVSNPWNPER
jgi:hypothetical protein